MTRFSRGPSEVVGFRMTGALVNEVRKLKSPWGYWQNSSNRRWGEARRKDDVLNPFAWYFQKNESRADGQLLMPLQSCLGGYIICTVCFGHMRLKSSLMQHESQESTTTQFSKGSILLTLFSRPPIHIYTHFISLWGRQRLQWESGKQDVKKTERQVWQNAFLTKISKEPFQVNLRRRFSVWVMLVLDSVTLAAVVW